MTSDRALSGWRVLVPRGGAWGDGVAARLRAHGASAVVAPVVNFAGSDDPAALAAALARLEAGEYAWIVVSSATTVDVLMSFGTTIPEGTRIAAVGETTSTALALAGYRVDFVPELDNSARGFVRSWPAEAEPGRVLVPQSELTDPTLEAGLARLGFQADFVVAYRTVGVPVAPEVVADVRSGRIRAVLVSSGSVARQIAAQFAPLGEDVVVVCIGPRTAFDTRAAGLPVHAIAEERSSQSLVDALVEYADEG